MDSMDRRLGRDRQDTDRVAGGRLHVHRDDDALAGTATGKGETVALHDITVDRQRVTWRQSVTKPMRLNLEFDVVVDGDRLTGHSRAGRLPRSAVTGVRRQGRIS